MESSPYYKTGKDIISPATLLSFEQGWQAPTAEEVRAVTHMTNLTGKQIADLIGVTSRTIRRYIGGEKPIHYAEWRLLLIYVGLITPELKPDVGT
ncbi:MAG: helix-turn-helix domain-containing protein [Gammaproteobacteria bacterium]